MPHYCDRVTTPTTAPLGPAPTTVPSWRACVTQALRCWFGGLALTIVIVPMLTFGSMRNALAAFGGFLLIMVAIAVISTLAALVIESLSSRTVPIGGHIGLIALAGVIVVALFSFDLTFAIVGFVLCLIAAALGALISIGRATWRRYAIVLGVAIMLFLLQLALD